MVFVSLIFWALFKHVGSLDHYCTLFAESCFRYLSFTADDLKLPLEGLNFAEAFGELINQ